MLELIENFLKWTAIRPETFGRLTLNDPWLVWRLKDGHQLPEEEKYRVIQFIRNYEDAKS
jgi:hypothetical protein